MSKYIFPFLLGALVLAVGLIIGLAVGGGGPVSVGGLVHSQQEIFVAGLKAGSSEEEVIDSSGYFTGTLSLSSSDSVTNAGTLTQSGAATFSDDTTLKSPVFSGTYATIPQTTGATSSVITAANVCDSVMATTTPSITGASTLTTPSAATLFSDCLTTNGDMEYLYVLNTTASTTVVTAGTSSTIAYDGSTGGSVTLAASSWAFLRFLRTSATAVVVIMDQFTF